MFLWDKHQYACQPKGIIQTPWFCLQSNSKPALHRLWVTLRTKPRRETHFLKNRIWPLPTRYNLKHKALQGTIWKKRSPWERIKNFEVKLNLTCDSSKLSLFSFKISPGVQWLSCQSGATSVATLPGYCQDSAKCTLYSLHLLPSFDPNLNFVNCFTSLYYIRCGSWPGCVGVTRWWQHGKWGWANFLHF